MKSVYFACAVMLLGAACAPSAATKAAQVAEKATKIAETAELGDEAWLEARALAHEAAAYLVAGLPGDAKLNWILAKGYDNGWYGEIDKDRACEHFLAAAEVAKLNGAYWPVALCYLNGTGVEQDAGTAFEWMTKSANAGDQSGMVSLAVLHATGQGTEKDLNAAATWYETTGSSSAAMPCWS